MWRGLSLSLRPPHRGILRVPAFRWTVGFWREWRDSTAAIVVMARGAVRTHTGASSSTAYTERKLDASDAIIRSEVP